MQAVNLSLIRLMGSKLDKLRSFTRTAFSTRYLFLTNVGISITLSGVGDIIEQKYEIYCGELEKHNLKRTRNMSVSGMTIGIFCHYWYKVLDRKLPGRTFKTVMKKVVVDQLIASPLCITTFFLTLAILENQSFDEFKKEVKQKAWKLYTAEWVIWPPAQIINFYFIPLHYRVLYDNTISLGYDIYTSHIVHSKPIKQSNYTNDSK